MRLSDAILAGSKLKPQGGPGTGDPALPRVCAWGAAHLAYQLSCGVKFIPQEFRNDEVVYPDTDWEWVDPNWDWTHTQVATCPACPACSAGPVSATIVHLNNDHRWTREAIALWVSTLEPSEPEPVPAVEPTNREEVNAEWQSMTSV